MVFLITNNTASPRLFSPKDSFQAWLEADHTFTMPLVNCPLPLNQLSITSIAPTVAGHLALGLRESWT